MMTPLLSALPRVLLVLLAASETGFCRVRSCPDYCTGSAVVVVDDKVTHIQGGSAGKFIQVIHRLNQTPPNGTIVLGWIGKTQVYMPKNLKFKIESILRRHPEIWKLIVKLLVKKFGKPKPGIHTRHTTKTPTRGRPTKKGTPVSNLKTTTRRRPTRKTKQTTTTKRPRAKPPHFKPPQHAGPLPDLIAPIIIPPGQKGVTPDIRTLLELLIQYPNFFAPNFLTLKELGVKIPQLGKNTTITWVLYNNQTVKLPKPLVVSYTVTVNGKKFILPADLKMLVTYLSKSPTQLPSVAILLHQLLATYTTDSKGRLTGLTVLGVKQKFPQPVSATIIVRGRTFVLPRDMKALIASITRNPADFYGMRALLEAFGVRIAKGSGQARIGVTYRNQTFTVQGVKEVKITINKRQYSIPSELEAIFKSERVASVGAVLAALQRANVVVKVDKWSGGIEGFVMDGVTIPFPLAVYLRLKIYGKTYIVPRDLPKIIAVLEKKGMPSTILSILYTHYGVVPVRGRDNVVVALSFNGRQYPIKAQPMTTITLGGVKIRLPRDNDKMIELVLSGKVSIVEFMQAVQLAGYKFIPEVDGALHKIQKGTEILNLPLEIRLSVQLNHITYRMPNDLPRLVNVLKSFGPSAIDAVTSELKKLGVRISRKGRLLVIVFNGVTYKVHLTGTSGGTELTMILNGKRFTLPKDLNALVTYATSLGSLGISAMISSLKSHGIKVNQLASGKIVSVVIDGKVYYIGTATIPDHKNNIQVSIRGKKYWIPSDLSKVTSLKGFYFSELVSALAKKGAKLQFDNDSYITGVIYRSRRIKFRRKFRIMVQVDKKGKKYRIPLDLGEVAKILSKGRWKWKEVRKALIHAGLKVPGGFSGHAIKKFYFMGKKYEVK